MVLFLVTPMQDARLATEGTPSVEIKQRGGSLHPCIPACTCTKPTRSRRPDRGQTRVYTLYTPQSNLERGKQCPSKNSLKVGVPILCLGHHSHVPVHVGIIGGSGLYKLSNLTVVSVFFPRSVHY